MEDITRVESSKEALATIGAMRVGSANSKSTWLIEEVSSADLESAKLIEGVSSSNLDSLS